jgi:hypothetical protein
MFGAAVDAVLRKSGEPTAAERGDAPEPADGFSMGDEANYNRARDISNHARADPLAALDRVGSKR